MADQTRRQRRVRAARHVVVDEVDVVAAKRDRRHRCGDTCGAKPLDAGDDRVHLPRGNGWMPLDDDLAPGPVAPLLGALAATAVGALERPSG